MRKPYLDNLRWATVLLVMIYHVFYLYNGVGIPGGLPGAESIPACDWLAGMVYPWFMVLLFAIAGISARYALRNRTEREFLRQRAVKLLVPSTCGLFVIHWITGYLNIRLGGGLDYIPPALIYPISAVSGIGPLWFIQMLFLFSCLLVLLRKLDKKDSVWTFCGRANYPVLLLLSFLMFGAAQVGNLPVLTMYRFGIYQAAFLLGYYVLSHEEVQGLLEKTRIPTACLALGMAAAYAACYGSGDYTSLLRLRSLVTNLYLWFTVLALLGFGRKYWNRETAFSRSMTASSYGYYLLHYPVLMLACCALRAYTTLPAAGNYLAALLLEFLLTAAAYEGIRRVPVVRFLVLGIRKQREC